MDFLSLGAGIYITDSHGERIRFRRLALLPAGCPFEWFEGARVRPSIAQVGIVRTDHDLRLLIPLSAQVAAERVEGVDRV